MYELFDNIIEYCGLIGDQPASAWYELYWEDAFDALCNFTENDWEALRKELPNKSCAWQQCMVFCFADQDNQHEIDILNDLAHTEDERLLIMAADAIRLYFDYEKFSNIEIIKSRVSDIIDRVNEPTRMILDAFLHPKTQHE